jgi:uncharacterized membrane protein
MGPFNPNAISADGAVVVGDNVRWTEADGMMDLGTLLAGETSSIAWDVSADGSIIVGRCNTANSQAAYRWTNETGKVLLEMNQDALAISADGSIIAGGYGTPVYWDELNIKHTLPIPSSFGMACDISPVNKDIVGYVFDPVYSLSRTVLWTQSSNYENMIDLGVGAWWHYGAISADGTVIVGYMQDTGAEAFRWTQETGEVGIGILPGKEYSYAEDVSSDGSIIVGFSYSTVQGSEAFIWDINDGMRSLKDILKNTYNIDLNGWTLTSATGITPDGRVIVGSGTDPNGNNQGWIINMNEPVILTIQVEPNNIGINTVIPGIGQHSYFSFLPVVSLKAEVFPKCPNIYRFSHWIGNVNDPNSSTTTITLTQNKTVTAVYYMDVKKCGDECHPILKGDLNGDCRINLDDFAIYCQQWLACTHPDCD